MSSSNTTATPKGTLTLTNVGTGFGKDNVKTGGLLTLKTVKDKLTAQVTIADGTFSFNRQFVTQIRKFQDVIVKADYKVRSDLTANGMLDLGIKKYTVGATWDGKIPKLDNKTTLKGWYSTANNLAWGEATVDVTQKGPFAQKAFVAFNQKQLVSAKYTLTKGSLTVEPGYNFVKSSPALIVTKKLKNKDSVKLMHDVKSEQSSVEYAHGAIKVSLSTKFGKSLKIGTKPNIAVTWEKTFKI